MKQMACGGLNMFTYIVLLSLFVLVSTDGLFSHEDELRRKLLTNYSSISVPSMRTVVKMRFTVLYLDMHEESQSLELQMWTSMEWDDPRLRWIPKDHYHIKKLAFPRDQIWHPDISLYNNAEASNFDHYSDAMIITISHGKVVWIPPTSLRAMCVMDMTYWPHDMHNCTANFGSWVHDGYILDVQPKDDFVLFEDVQMFDKEKNLSRGEWKVLGTSVKRNVNKYPCCEEPYVTIHMSVLLERAAPAYKWIVQIPCIALCILTIVVFILPPSSGEKVILGGIGLFLDFFFLIAVSQIIGHAPSHTPLIIKLIVKQLILTLISIIFCCIVLRFMRDPHTEGLPRCIKGPLLSIAPCFCLSSYRHMVSSVVPFSRSMKAEDLELNEGSNGRGLFGPENRNADGDWLLLAAFIDRICLIVYVAVFLANISTFSGVL